MRLAVVGSAILLTVQANDCLNTAIAALCASTGAQCMDYDNAVGVGWECYCTGVYPPIVGQGAATPADCPGFVRTPTPATSAPATSAPATPAPATSAPATSSPATSSPATSAPATPAPATPAPATPAPATPAPPTSSPATSSPASPAPPTPAPPVTSAHSSSTSTATTATAAASATSDTKISDPCAAASIPNCTDYAATADRARCFCRVCVGGHRPAPGGGRCDAVAEPEAEAEPARAGPDYALLAGVLAGGLCCFAAVLGVCLWRRYTRGRRGAADVVYQASPMDMSLGDFTQSMESLSLTRLTGTATATVTPEPKAVTSTALFSVSMGGKTFTTLEASAAGNAAGDGGGGGGGDGDGVEYKYESSLRSLLGRGSNSSIRRPRTTCLRPVRTDNLSPRASLPPLGSLSNLRSASPPVERRGRAAAFVDGVRDACGGVRPAGLLPAS